MNLENKRQLATIGLAVGLGIVAVMLTSNYITESVNNQVRDLATEYQKQNEGMKQELSFVRQELKKAAQGQKQLRDEIVKLKQRPTQRVVVQDGGPSDQEVVDTTAFSTKLPPGKRAYTVMIDSLSAVGGLISPGDYVDIIAQLDMPHPTDPEGGKQKVTTVLFQNLQVLAVGTNFDPIISTKIYRDQTKARTLNVTLALDAEEAGLLAFAQTNGKLNLSLRSPASTQTETLEIASWDTLADYVEDRQGTELAVPMKRTTFTTGDDDTEAAPLIRIIRGGQEL